MSEITIDAILDGDDDLALPPRHIRHDCECRIVEAPAENIEQIVHNGGVPILNLEPNGTDKLGLVAKPFDGTASYVIIWHRPDDEFASARYNTITTCQLIRLADRLGALHLREGGKEMCFWMQALCSSGVEDAGLDLKEIISKAYALLIMDSEWLLSRSTAQQTTSEYIASLKSHHSELTLAGRVLLMSPTGFHIEVNGRGDAVVSNDN